MTSVKIPLTPADLETELQRISDRTRTWGRVSTTPAAIAQTPKEVVWTLNKAKLYRYVPVVPAEKRHKVPLLLIFALMNRPSILDLRPGGSFVEYMVKHGYDVYLLDWGVPSIEDKNYKIDDYVLDYMVRAMRKVKSISGSDAVSMLGWCIGAILTTSYAALRPEDGLRNLILLTAPLDFTQKGSLTFARWTDSSYFDLEKVLATFGNMPGEMIDYGARMLKPVDNFLTSYIRLWDNLEDPRIVDSWHAMNTWMSDLTPMAGATYRQLINDLYRQNKLIKSELMLRGEQVKLANLRANLLNVIAEGDHITPPCQSETIVDLISSQDKTTLRVPGGHIGIMAGSGAIKSTWPKIDTWLGERSM
jgi:polyhydroxyalkanoate synthase